MKSRTFCCNGTLLRKNLQRGLPLWGIYLLCWIVVLPLNLISSSDWMDAVDAERRVLEAAFVNSHIIPCLYGLAAACLLFSYLYKSRSANFFAALPLRRETHFVTNYTAGLLYALIPNLIIATLTLLAGGFVEANLLREVSIWYGLSALSYVFFFSFATLCAMLVGHLAALPILYGIANFMVIILESIIGSLLSTFVFGMYYNGNGNLLPFSPVAYMLSESVPDVTTVWSQDIRTGAAVENWEYLLVLFAVGIVFAVLAFFLRKGRRMEAAGDVIAVHRLKPVFLYCFTIGCSLVIGYVLAAMLVDYSNPANFFAILLCLLAGAFLGYFGGQMMLHKSLRVFRKQYWINLAVVCAVITAAMVCCRLDVFGYSRYVPEAEQVEAISLDYGGGTYTDDPRLIELTVALHGDIVEQQDLVEKPVYNGYRRGVYLNYRLKSGRTVLRRYELPIDYNDKSPDSLIRQYEEIYNDPAYVLARNLPAEYTVDNISYAMAWDKTSSEHTLTARQAYRLLKEGVEEDIKAGVLETRYWSKDGPVATATPEYLDLHLEITFTGLADEEWNRRYCSFSFHADCVNSLKILKEYGLITEPVSPTP